MRPRSKHGVIYDFTQKLKANPKELEILGDRTQNKSCLHINDRTESMFLCLEKTRNQVETYNIGSEDHNTQQAIMKVAGHSTTRLMAFEVMKK
jgi:UDP-glucose 4-epimerase